ncbi:SH3 domain-containing protein [Cristinia sonorae]|uniref:SH3 domain-containing protein n=1 Tax=Cristinia sonorae TaxID=1940300 RepID=A0A8K0UJ42_9AGAR|nr:SH3 domain-containing protein [Cristinia sonorae]
MAESALLAHIVSQTKANVSFLAAHNHLSQADANTMLSRLDAIESKGITSPQASLATLTNSLHSMSVSTPAPVVAVTPEPTRREVPPPPSRTQKARALWAYNEEGQEPNDLSFAPGEIIEIVDETNADWWTGKCRGKQGLFPSNHVEKIAASAPSPAPAAPHTLPTPAATPSSYSPPAWSPPSGPPMPSMPMPGTPYHGEKSAPFPPYGGYGAPSGPPPGPSYAPPPGAPAPPVAVDGPKKKKFGGDLGKTMATAAAGGVGFGAGECQLFISHI